MINMLHYIITLTGDTKDIIPINYQDYQVRNVASIVFTKFSMILSGDLVLDLT